MQEISWIFGPIIWTKSSKSNTVTNGSDFMQVTWDEPDLLQGIARVNPWQVELVSSAPPVVVTNTSTPHYMHNIHIDHSHAMPPLPFVLPKRKAARHDYNLQQPYSRSRNDDEHQLDVSEGDGIEQQQPGGGLSMPSAAPSHHIFPANISISNRLKPDRDAPIGMRGARHSTAEGSYSESSSLLHSGTRSRHFYLFGTPISMGSSSQSVINTGSVAATHKEEHEMKHSHEDTR